MEEEYKYPKTSPLVIVSKEKTKKMMNFGQAMQAVLDKKRVKRLEWSIGWAAYLYEKEAILAIENPQGKINSWVISEGDLLGEDYIEI